MKFFQLARGVLDAGFERPGMGEIADGDLERSFHWRVPVGGRSLTTASHRVGMAGLTWIKPGSVRRGRCATAAPPLHAIDPYQTPRRVCESNSDR
jgi:hypothetical protein